MFPYDSPEGLFKAELNSCLFNCLEKQVMKVNFIAEREYSLTSDKETLKKLIYLVC